MLIRKDLRVFTACPLRLLVAWFEMRLVWRLRMLMRLLKLRGKLLMRSIAVVLSRPFIIRSTVLTLSFRLRRLVMLMIRLLRRTRIFRFRPKAVIVM